MGLQSNLGVSDRLYKKEVARKYMLKVHKKKEQLSVLMYEGHWTYYSRIYWTK